MTAPVPPSFGLLERGMASGVISHLSNASVSWRSGAAGGAWVTGLRAIFVRDASSGLEGLVNDANPVLSVFDGFMPEVSRGDLVEVTPDASQQPKTFEVVRVLPDGQGIVVLHLIDEGSL